MEVRVCRVAGRGVGGRVCRVVRRGVGGRVCIGRGKVLSGALRDLVKLWKVCVCVCVCV